MPQMMWTKYFMDAQNYTCTHQLQQDNTSAMQLELNGKASSDKRTKHMAVRYFFMKDRVDAGDLTIHHCPTGDMVGDFFTKPLQGAAFIKFRDLIMGNVAHDFTQENEQQRIGTTTPRSVLGDINNARPSDVTSQVKGMNGLGNSAHNARTGGEWTTIKRSKRIKKVRIKEQ